jgi:multiple sugar transport system substrate-binding protein
MTFQILGPDDPALYVLDQQLKSHPEWDAQLKIIPWAQYQPEMMAALKAPVSPYQAVCIPGHIWMPGLVSENLLAHFDQLLPQVSEEIKQAYQVSDIMPSVQRESQYQGRQYLLPLFTDGHIVFYRKDLVKIEGANLIDPLSIHTILEKLDLKAKGIYPFALKADLSEIFLDWLPYFWAAGGQILDDQGKPAFASQAGVKALEYYISLKKYCPPDTHLYGNQQIAEALLNGKVAMAASWGGQAAPIFDKNSPHAGSFATLVFTKPWNATWGVSLPANQPAADQVKMLSTLYTAASPEQDRQVTRIAGSPVRLSSYSDHEKAEFGWLDSQHEMLKRCAMLPGDPGLAIYLGPLYSAIYEAFTGVTSPLTALEKAAKSL